MSPTEVSQPTTIDIQDVKRDDQGDVVDPPGRKRHHLSVDMSVVSKRVSIQSQQDQKGKQGKRAPVVLKDSLASVEERDEDTPEGQPSKGSGQYGRPEQLRKQQTLKLPSDETLVQEGEQEPLGGRHSTGKQPIRSAMRKPSIQDSPAVAQVAVARRQSHSQSQSVQGPQWHLASPIDGQSIVSPTSPPPSSNTGQPAPHKVQLHAKPAKQSSVPEVAIHIRPEAGPALIKAQA
jgi:hypothetical protein